MTSKETLQIETEIDGALKTITVDFVYRGINDVLLERIHPGHVSELTFTERMTISSKIVAHKLGHKGIRVN